MSPEDAEHAATDAVVAHRAELATDGVSLADAMDGMHVILGAAADSVGCSPPRTRTVRSWRREESKR